MLLAMVGTGLRRAAGSIKQGMCCSSGSGSSGSWQWQEQLLHAIKVPTVFEHCRSYATPPLRPLMLCR
jgi:hypothetical protein